MPCKCPWQVRTRLPPGRLRPDCLVTGCLMNYRTALATLLMGTIAPLSSAQDGAPYGVARVSGPVRIDGMSDEPGWDGVAPWIPVQYEPDNGAAATERTEFLVAHDDDYIYFALRAFDTDPDGIRANTLYRDRLSGDDHFEILLDTFNDNETGVLFTTTPEGIRKDAAISNDASGGGIASGGWINGDFNTFWDVETAITGQGWFAEIRVPFSSLRFQDRDGEIVMGITLQRKVARKTERVVYPPVPSIADWAFLKPSLAKKIVLRGIRSRNPVYITPYGLGAQDATSGAPAQRSLQAGVDLKYGLTNEITLDVTVNTDFAQAEADDQQVNLTRFSLFFPEKRQFFQERSGIFDFRTGGLSRLFHSRRIGLTDDGRPVGLLGGGRIVGRRGAWDVGLLSLMTERHDELAPENIGVARLRRQVFNPYSYAGVMGTSRIDTDGAYNVAYGLDSVVRLRGDDYMTLQWAQSFDSRLLDSGDQRGLNSARATFELERRRRRGWGYNTVLARAGRLYRPGAGFTQRNDFTLVEQGGSYTWLHGSDSPLIWHAVRMEASAFLRNADRSVESAEIGPEWEFRAKSGAGGSIQARLHREVPQRSFRIADALLVPAGDYRFWRLGARYSVTHTSRVQIRPRVEAGTFYDGFNTSIAIAPLWYISPHLELSGNYSYTHIRFGARDAMLDIHLAGIRIGTALNTKVSANAFVQYNSTRDNLSANIRFRYNFREGNDLWVVYNTNQYAEDHRGRYEPLSDSQTILVKYTHTLGY